MRLAKTAPPNDKSSLVPDDAAVESLARKVSESHLHSMASEFIWGPRSGDIPRTLATGGAAHEDTLYDSKTSDATSEAAVSCIAGIACE